MKYDPTLIEKFFKAVLFNRIPELEEIVKTDPDIVNLKQEQGKKDTALHQAADRGRTDLVKWLIDHNADLEATDDHGFTPLHRIIRSDYVKFIDIVKLLIDSGANIQTRNNFEGTLLHSVVSMGGMVGSEMLIYLLGQNDMSLIINAKDNDGHTPLRGAVFWGRVEMAKLLIQKGADVTVTDTNDKTLLHVIPGYSKSILDLVKYFILECNFDIHGKDKAGRTPLHYAGKTGDVDTAKFLIDQGANIDETDNKGQTVLHLAASEEQSFQDKKNDCMKEMVKLLISRGAKNDKIDKLGQTPLHCAVFEGNVAIIKYLLDTKIGLDIKDNYGLTAAVYVDFRLKLRKPNSEIYDFFNSIQETHIKESLIESIPRLYAIKAYDLRLFSIFRATQELQEMVDLFSNAEKKQYLMR